MKRFFIVLGLCAAGLAWAAGAAAESQSWACVGCHLGQTRDWDFSIKAVTTERVKGHKPAMEHQLSECGWCHSADYILAPAGQTPKSWDQVSAGITCRVCHLDHTRGERPGDRTPVSCEQCHSALARGITLGAASVYNPQAEVFRGAAPEFLEMQSVPNRWTNKTCADCHFPRVNKDRRSHSLRPNLPGSKEFSCGQLGCHEGKAEEYTDLARRWQRETERELRAVRGLLAAKKNLTPANPANLKHYQIAKYQTDLVSGDLSAGVHNIDYVRALLAEARRHLAEVK